MEHNQSLATVWVRRSEMTDGPIEVSVSPVSESAAAVDQSAQNALAVKDEPIRKPSDAGNSEVKATPSSPTNAGGHPRTNSMIEGKDLKTVSYGAENSCI